MGVSRKLGYTISTCTPSATSSCRSTSKYCASAALAAPYPARPGTGIHPAMEPMHTRLPCDARSSGNASAVSATGRW